MRSYFNDLVDTLCGTVRGDEVLTCFFEAEQSDFVRFNSGRVRQAGAVRQSEISLDLISGSRHAPIRLTLSGVLDEDLGRCKAALEQQRSVLADSPEDPHLLYNTEVSSSERVDPSDLPPTADLVDAIVEAGQDLDLVGILAAGPMARGFANSLGQRNWFRTASFHFDWSLYAHGDKAVKSSFAGTEWDPARFGRKMDQAKRELAVVGLPARRVEPGAYRAYLSPSAMMEILGLLSWGALGLKEQKTRRSSLMRAVEGESNLHPCFHLKANVSGGLTPDFCPSGFPRPEGVQLFTEGRLVDSLVSPRSSREYGVPTNGAAAEEYPESLEMGSGETSTEGLVEALDTGVWVNNLWYLNYSDRPACRMTGMTRFATFWVEGGEIVAPLDVMRFDDTLYRMLGEGLTGLTDECELLMDAHTYGRRSLGFARLPGAMVEDFVFTL